MLIENVSSYKLTQRCSPNAQLWQLDPVAPIQLETDTDASGLALSRLILGSSVHVTVLGGQNILRRIFRGSIPATPHRIYAPVKARSDDDDDNCIGSTLGKLHACCQWNFHWNFE